MDLPLELTFLPGEGPCVGIDCVDGENEFETGDEEQDASLASDRDIATGTYWFPVTR